MRIPSGRIRRVVRRIGREFRLFPDLTLVFLGDREIRRVNKKYLRHDRPTDVIAFPYHPSLVFPRFSGDILISLDAARRQARALGHPVWREVKILMIHGILHLLGFRDHRRSDRLKMWKRTGEILAKVERL